MYPKIAIVSLLGKSDKIVFGTDKEYLSNEEAADHIKQQWYGLTDAPSASDIYMVTVIPNDSYPYMIY